MGDPLCKSGSDFAEATLKLRRVVMLSKDDMDNLDFLTAEAQQQAKAPVSPERMLSALLEGAAWDAADGIIYTPKGGW